MSAAWRVPIYQYAPVILIYKEIHLQRSVHLKIWHKFVQADLNENKNETIY